MSAIFIAIVAFGLFGAAVFISGFIVAVREAVRERRDGAPEGEWVDKGRYGWSAFFAVFASAVVIALAGVNPIWIYAGPLLAIVTATGVGIAFFVGREKTVAAPSLEQTVAEVTREQTQQEEGASARLHPARRQQPCHRNVAPSQGQGRLAFRARGVLAAHGAHDGARSVRRRLHRRRARAVQHP